MVLLPLYSLVWKYSVTFWNSDGVNDSSDVVECIYIYEYEKGI